MSDEELEAIEEVKEVIRIDKERRIVTIYDEKPLFRDQLQTLLDLIEKQQKEIEELKKDKKDNIQVVYGGRRYGTEVMAVKDYISKDKIREVLKDLDEFDDYFFNVSTLKEATKNSLNRLLEE